MGDELQDTADRASPAGARQADDDVAAPASQADRTFQVATAILAFAAFGIFWVSSSVLEARRATSLFGADTWFYILLVDPTVLGRIAADYHLDRVARFHVTTVAAAVAWMKLLVPLGEWTTPQLWLKAMFAATGAVGVWAAVRAFAAFVPAAFALLFGAIYASSFSVWYFSSIEESKIVTATLTAIYIAGYLRLRTRWDWRLAAALAVVMFVACLNEVVAGFLLVIPAVDMLLQRRFDRERIRWITIHAATCPFALLVLEFAIGGSQAAAARHAEGASHFSMFFYYVARNDYGLASLYSFFANWLFFNIAAPKPEAMHALAAWPTYRGYFQPSLLDYFRAPLPALTLLLMLAVVAVSVLPRRRTLLDAGTRSILMALAAYVALRTTFFLVFSPTEPLLFSSSITLALLLIVAVPFAASALPGRQSLLTALAAMLLLTNASFMVGRVGAGAPPGSSAAAAEQPGRNTKVAANAGAKAKKKGTEPAKRPRS